MPKKGKKKKGKKGKKKGYGPPVYEIFPYEDPAEIVAKVTIKLRLANPNVPDLDQIIEFPINQKLEYLVHSIKEKHKGAVFNVVIYKDAEELKETLDLDKTLSDSGLELKAEMLLYYDFKPVSHPVLF